MSVKFRKFIIIVFGIIIGCFFVLLVSVISLRWINPPLTAFTLQEDWEEVNTERYNLRNYWIPYGQIPEHLRWAVIASEDQRFLEHWGLDLEAIDEALEERRAGIRERGASTITQQVAKNLYLWPAQSLFRKAIEAGIAVMIEMFWPKERILEMYLNIAEFGPGIFGIGRAGEVIFGMEPSGLTADASARLAAVLPNPKRMRPEPPTPYALERSRWILRQMTQLTGINYLPPGEPDITEIEDMEEPEMPDFDWDLPDWDTLGRDAPGLDTLDTDVPDVDTLDSETPDADTLETDMLDEVMLERDTLEVDTLDTDPS